LQWVDPDTYRGGNTRLRGRGDPSSDAGEDQSSGNGEQIDLAHLNSSVHTSFGLAQATIRPSRIVPMSLAIDFGIVCIDHACAIDARGRLSMRSSPTPL
jgi:hypothetical protein